MNKAVTKSLLTQAGITCVPWQLLIKHDLELLKNGSLDITINFPIFVKPVDAGSSIGVARVCDNSELIKAIEEAFKYSGEVILEPEIKGRELECAVLSGMSYATVPGEVLVNKNYDFYDYQAKYEDADASKTIVPADISDDLSSKMRSIALRAAMALRANIMSRVDFFIDEERNIYVNEVNSIPGFTDISMYSKLWQHSGISMPQLLDHLINQVSV